jgi:hypothetical protein
MIWDKKKRIPHFCNDFKWECFACSCTLKMENKKSPAFCLRKLAVHCLMCSAAFFLFSIVWPSLSFCLSLSLSSLVLWLLVTFPSMQSLISYAMASWTN